MKIPFKTKEKKNLSSDNIISKLIENDIYIEIKIGTPTQNIPLYLKLNQFPTFITSSNYSKNISKFDYSKSKTFDLKQTEDSNFSKQNFLPKHYITSMPSNILNLNID